MANTTKFWIAEVMKKLLSKKPIEKIRVTEICQEAGIERPTFYYHFKDKYDLMAWIVFQCSLDTDITDLTSATKAMEQMKKDLIFYKRAFEDNSQDPMWQYMLDLSIRRHNQIVMDKLQCDQLDVQTEFSIRMYCYGALGISREWILNDDFTSAKTIVTMMFKAMPDDLKKILFEDNS